MNKILFISLLFLSQLGFSQNFQSTITDFFQANIYLSKARQYKIIEKNEAFENIKKGLHIAKKLSSPTLLANFYYTKSKVFDYNYEYDSSHFYYKMAALNFIKIDDSINAAKCFINIGATDYYYGNFDSAFVAFTNASIFLENSDEFVLNAKVMNNIGLLNKSNGKYQEAITDFHKSLDYNEKANNQIGIANSYQNIGIIYLEQKNYNEALRCFNDAVLILENTEEYNDLGGVYTNIGIIFNEKEDTSQALFYYDKAIELYSQTNNQLGLATILLNKGILVDKAGFYDEAEILFSHSLQIFKEIGYAQGIFLGKINLSSIYSKKNENSNAINFALEALSLETTNQPIKYLADAYLVLSHNYSNTNNYKSSNFYLNKYIKINDSIYNLEKNKQINELRTMYETDKKENKIIILEQEAQIQSLEIEKKNKRIKTITFILIIIIFFSVISIILYFQKQTSYLALVEQNVKLTKSDIEKETTIQKYAETNLDKTQKKELIDNIIVLMEEKKYYLNAQFTINDFAKKLHSNRSYLSLIINEHFGSNFNNFVNEYRVKEARKYLLNPDFKNYTIEGIGNTVGFHSKATFNNAFKKFTGVTPSFFRKNSKIL